ncbi:MAG: hypothetical protein JSS79_18710 [Bacteroidetes bacterium]|nr:hypothetical protein [Bacteroidota bacterium]
MMPTKILFTIVLLTGFLYSCSQGKKESGDFPDHKIKIAVIDTSNVRLCLWRVNRVLEKEHPEYFKKPINYSDTANEHYITHYVKRHTLTVAGRTTRTDNFCVAPKDTFRLNLMRRSPNYDSIFIPGSYFAFQFEKNKYHDLYLLTNQSITFLKSDLTEFSMEPGTTAVVVKLNTEAGKRLQVFTEQNVGKMLAFLIDGVIYYIAKLGAPLNTNLFVIYPETTSGELSKQLFSPQGK